MEKLKLTFTEQEARNIVYEDHEDFEVISDEIHDERRWVNCHEVIVKRISDGKFFRSHYEVGKTESQDQRPYEYDDPTFHEVFKTTKTITVYE